MQAHLPGARHILIHWARRTQGLICAPGNPLGITDLKDAAARGLRFALRTDAAGSQRLLNILLARHGLSAADLNMAAPPVDTHADLAALIESGEADCGFGLQSAAAHLGFLPLIADESFDLAMARRDYFEPAIQNLAHLRPQRGLRPPSRLSRRLRHCGSRQGAVEWLRPCISSRQEA